MLECLLEGLATVPVLTEHAATVTGPNVTTETDKELLLVRPFARFIALVALLYRKA